MKEYGEWDSIDWAIGTVLTLGTIVGVGFALSRPPNPNPPKPYLGVCHETTCVISDEKMCLKWLSEPVVCP